MCSACMNVSVFHSETGAHFVAQPGLILKAMLLPQSLKHWDYRHWSPHLLCIVSQQSKIGLAEQLPLCLVLFI